MVHLRLNETESNPNPHINFITALPSSPDAQEDARKLLRALAAQVRPIMKEHGFVVNSFEEYEYNNVFAGRNWNNGETVELVLRRADGTFYPMYWLMGTLCHELAHIKHMNHGPAFQALWSHLRLQVRKLQDQGYYGDGYWSSGTRLRDSARVGGEGIEEGDFPEYMCGGAQSRTRPTARRRRAQGKRREVVPSLHTGAQTAKKRKSGARVTSKYAFTGEGSALANDGKGTGFGKQAASKRAREERALAAERRLLALRQESEPASQPPVTPNEEEFSDDDEVGFVPETDAERRQALLSSEPDGKSLNQKLGSRNSWKQFQDDFDFEAKSNTASGSKPQLNMVDISSDEDTGNDTCDLPVASGSTFTTQSSSLPTIVTSKGKSKAKLRPVPDVVGEGNKTLKPVTHTPFGLGKMVKTEIDLRKKESLGMAPVKGGGRTLGSKPTTVLNPVLKPTDPEPVEKPWNCLICTLENAPGHLSCAACASLRGQDAWLRQT